ncbi:unnamed protein product [Heligmosomoides polygyrus]|uniref:Reverse transcriptase domain-containing protein n=1 Tax=Heligmosomoides polygyrus TaxID=6339 RepID=A0A183F2X8_HELPZ|nr:unnamed protein product [Heligmosomoides polygyrus]
MMTLKTRCDAKKVLRCSPVDDIADVATYAFASPTSVTCRSVGDASTKYNIGLTPSISQAERMLADFNNVCWNAGLQLNLTKTMLMRNGQVSYAPFSLNGTNISDVRLRSHLFGSTVPSCASIRLRDLSYTKEG